MRKIRWIVTALAYSVATTSLYSQEDDIVVHLQTESRLIPLYMTHITADQSQFDKGYVDQLEGVLRFDLLHNGTTRLMEFNPQREELARRSSTQPGQLLPQWKGTGIAHLVVPIIIGNQLSVRLLSINTGAVKEIAGLLLTGQLDKDRRQIHQVSDTLHQEMTNRPGIATTRILYTVKSKGTGNDWLSDVWESDYDGANARLITRNREYCVTPSYIPSKTSGSPKQFLYVGYGSGQPRIFCASLDEGKGQRMTNAKGNQLTPALSRQRDQLAFICDSRGNPDLYVQSFNPDTGKGGKIQLLFHKAGATESSPTFSPNGREIAFTSDQDGSPRIYLMGLPIPGADFKAGKPKLVSRRALNGSAPAWSPDGQKIAFCALTQGNRQIWVYDCGTKEETQLTFSPGHKENPSWAPNSLHLVYNTANTNESELYIVDLNRMKPVKISSGKGEKRFPSWEVR